MTTQKRGKKNVIKLDPFAYNLGIMGESGIGKTTVTVELLDKHLGEDGYILLNCGKEDGVDAIPDAIYEDIKSFTDLELFVKDIIRDKNTLYKDLKVVVIDTLDELFRITEPHVIKLHNLKAAPDKRTDSLNGAFGGFGKGEDKVIEVVLDKIWELKEVGIQPFFLAHTKTKTKSDAMSGTDYEILTNNMKDKYFNAVKTKVHLLGVASFDRSIDKKITKNKLGQSVTKGKVVDESRVLTFRSEKLSVDSKSRFADIVDSVPLNPDAIYEAFMDAIKSAHNKQRNKKSFEETEKEQKVEYEAKIEEIVNQKSEVDSQRNLELTSLIVKMFTKAEKETKHEVVSLMETYGIPTFNEDDVLTVKTEGLEEIAKLLHSATK